MLLGHARGKVGDLVFSRSNGQQVTRARAAVVKNPQTTAQMIQRIMLNTIAQAYSRFRPICDHSFEGVQEGQDSQSAFLSRNLKALRARVEAAVSQGKDLYQVYGFTPIGSNVFSIGAFVMSSGTLPAVNVTTVATGQGKQFATASLGGTTYGEIIGALGLQRGDQLTFMMIIGLSGDLRRFEYVRVILDPTNADGSSAPLATPFLVDGAINLPSPRNTGAFTSATLSSEGVFSFHLGLASYEALAAGVIVSRKVGNSWLRSNCQLTIDEEELEISENSLQSCLDDFEEGTINTQSHMYLNNSGTGRLATAGTSGLTVAQVKASIIQVTGVTMADVVAFKSGGDGYPSNVDLSGNGNIYIKSTEAANVIVNLPAEAASVTKVNPSTGGGIFTWPYSGHKNMLRLNVQQTDFADASTLPIVFTVDGVTCGLTFEKA